jgi:toxin-antitoxin system PIN domain toxin
MKSYFPDLNVWVALTYRGHQQHRVAASWFDRLRVEVTGFCRVTQIGFLRLLTRPVVMGDEVRTQQEAWDAYDLLASDARVVFYPERDPDAVESEFRALTATTRFAPQQWLDAYLAAFARAEGLVLVTFDRALSKLAGEGVVLLK